jgi:hypothetical protein
MPFFKYNGYNVYYEETREGFPLIVLHGNSVSSKLFDYVIDLYSENNRITPLLEPKNCLVNHVQYICGTCGRCICINKDDKRNLGGA